MSITAPTINVPTHLKKRIQEKIDSIKAVEENFPGAIIIHNSRTVEVVYMSKWGREYLGVSLEELHEMGGPNYFSRYFNAEDAKDYVPKILAYLERNDQEEFITYFQQVRQSPNHEWRWFQSSVKTILRDDDGIPILTLTYASPVEAQHHIASKATRLLEENNFLRNNYHVFDQLTNREKQILKLMAMGNSSLEISSVLHISEATASTHRRNIRRKLNVESNYDITRFAQAFDLI